MSKASVKNLHTRTTSLSHAVDGSTQVGFSLIEVLVAIIVLSVGMLGAVGMQSAALRSNKESKNLAAAVMFARELGERMRGNHSVAIKTVASDNPYLFDTTLRVLQASRPSTSIVLQLAVQFRRIRPLGTWPTGKGASLQPFPRRGSKCASTKIPTTAQALRGGLAPMMATSPF